MSPSHSSTFQPGLQDLKVELKKLANPEKAKILQKFFQTGPGQYGEGDIFLGLTVPENRKLAKKYQHLTLNEILILLQSKLHEERLLALLILIIQFKKGNPALQEKIYNLYLDNITFINNWDLIDTSAEYIIGAYLENKPQDILKTLALSVNVWERRIAIMSTFHYIKKGRYQETFKIAEILLQDKHDLIQKAVGWMLREIGKRCSQQVEENFLKERYKIMPRTMLRYAIERFPEQLRKKYLRDEI